METQYQQKEHKLVTTMHCLIRLLFPDQLEWIPMISNLMLFYTFLILQLIIWQCKRILLCWIPSCHDMGIIGNVLSSIFSGMHVIFTNSLNFLNHPDRLLTTITKLKVVVLFYSLYLYINKKLFRLRIFQPPILCTIYVFKKFQIHFFLQLTYLT